MTITLAAAQGVWPPVPDAALLAGYRRDVAPYLRFYGVAATALAPAWPLHSFPVWPGWGSLPLGRPLGGRRGAGAARSKAEAVPGWSAL